MFRYISLATKQSLYKAFFVSGLYNLLRYRNRHSITILMCHGVVSRSYQGQWTPTWERITKEHFDEKIKLLKKYYTILSMDDAAKILKGEKEPVKHGLVLTFDDGYKNFSTEVVPVLQENGIKAIVYLVPGLIKKNKRFWIDRLDYLLQKNTKQTLKISVGDSKFDFTRMSSDIKALTLNYKKFRLALKQTYNNDYEMNKFLEDMLNKFEIKTNLSLSGMKQDLWSELMSWDEINNLPDSVGIGSHTDNHYRLPFISLDDAQWEVSSSKSTISRMTDSICIHFCYPNGDWNVATKDLVKNAGYASAVTTDEGLNNIGCDMYSLKRIPFPYEKNNEKFLFRISGYQS